MTYKELIETLEIIAKYDGGLDNECLIMWAAHEEHGFGFKKTWNVEAKDIRRLAEIGWGLGSDDEYDEEESEKWKHPENLSDEELVEIFNNYSGIYTYE